MSFHESAEDIHLSDSHILVAQLRNGDGELVHAEIDLNQHLGNDNGQFTWDGVNFSESASEVEFDIEGETNQPVLRAKLATPEGDEIDANVNLAERIINDNGSFVFQV